MKKIKNNKLIAEFSFKNKSVGGNDIQTFVGVRKNGTVDITRFILIEGNKDYYGLVKVKTMFGKSVYMQRHGYRLETLKLICHHAQKIMAEAGVKLSDLA